MGSAPSELSIVSVTSARPSGGPPGRAGEDDVLHLAAAQRLRALLAEHPADRVDDVGLARAVRADDAGDARLEAQRRRRGEGLEALQRQALEVHGRGSGLRSRCPRAYRSADPPPSGLDEAPETAARVAPLLDDPVRPGRVRAPPRRARAAPRRPRRYPPRPRPRGRRSGCAPRPPGRARAPATGSTSGNPRPGQALHPGGEADRRFGHALR